MPPPFRATFLMVVAVVQYTLLLSRANARGDTWPVAKTVALKIRYGDFSTLTRQVQLPEPTDLAEVLYETGVKMLRTRVTLKGRQVRLIGLGAAGLAEAGQGQLKLFTDPLDDKRRRAAEAVDEVRARIGNDAIVRGSLLKSEEDPDEE